MTFKQTMASLFSTAEGTYYKWKKENRPIIGLLEKYFTQDELEEFVSYGTISKLEYLKYSSNQHFGLKIAKFVETLYDTKIHIDEYVRYDCIDYLAFSFHYLGDYGGESDGFSVGHIQSSMINAYDDYKSIINNSISSSDIGYISTHFGDFYPTDIDFKDVIYFLTYVNSFIDIVKYSIWSHRSRDNYVELVDIAIEFCIRYNLGCVNNGNVEFEDIYNKYSVLAGQNLIEEFNFKDFKNEILSLNPIEKDISNVVLGISS